MKSPLRQFLCAIALYALLLNACDQRSRTEPGGQPDVIDDIALQPDSAGTGLASDGVIQLGLPTEARQQSGKLFPVDEGPLSGSFNRFRTRLLRAIGQRDTAFIMQMVDQDSKISFGGEGGRSGFRIMWGLGQDYRSSPLWDVLDRLLRLGGQFEGADRSVFIAPYVYSAWPDMYDAFTHGVITGNHVRIRAEPGTDGGVLTGLSYDLVGYQGARTPEADTIGSEVFPWYRIILPDGRPGWVFGRYFRSPLDFRASFEEVQDGWRLRFLVAGD